MSENLIRTKDSFTKKRTFEVSPRVEAIPKLGAENWQKFGPRVDVNDVDFFAQIAFTVVSPNKGTQIREKFPYLGQNSKLFEIRESLIWSKIRSKTPNFPNKKAILRAFDIVIDLRQDKS